MESMEGSLMEEMEKTRVLEAEKHQHESTNNIIIPNEGSYVLGEILGSL
jgi:hypothetical protein